MITAVDTNVLLDILVPNETFYEKSADALQDAAGQGSLAISDIVYAELCVHFNTQRECDVFLDSTEIRLQALTREAHFLASRVWQTYRKQARTRSRILADFLIGAHAQKQASRLLSRDRGFTASCFRRLTFVTRPNPENAKTGDGIYLRSAIRAPIQVDYCACHRMLAFATFM